MIFLTRCIACSLALCALIIATAADAKTPDTPTPRSGASVLEASRHGDPININSATLKDLESLPGFGPARARKIVAGRPYASVEDLKVRKVVPLKTYDRIRNQISTQGTMKTDSGKKADSLMKSSSD